jgi:NADH-quinone oxidoreductase subunit E
VPVAKKEPKMAQVSTQAVDRMIERYGGDSDSLIQILQDVQEKYGYLPRPALEKVARGLNVPTSRVYNVATFYAAFSLTPKGRHRIHVCLGTACHVRGAQLIADKVHRDLGIAAGGTTADGEFSVDHVACVGACAMGPVVVVDGEVHGEVTQAKIDRMLRAFTREKAAVQAPEAAADKTPAGKNGKAKKPAATAKAKKPAAKKPAPKKAAAGKAAPKKPAAKKAAKKATVKKAVPKKVVAKKAAPGKKRTR